MKGSTQIKRLLPLALACSILVGTCPLAPAASGDVNSINVGESVQGGTYFNTEGSRTVFTNPGGGLRLNAGQLVRGLESNINKVPTGNGGTLQFSAPGNVIRLDGDIDVSALRDGSMYLGNGGKVFVDSAYLFQNGNIFANGVNGGLVQMNVGSMTMGPNAKITAQGFGGNGGTVSINSPGIVDLQGGTIIDTSGKVVGTYNTNVINITGGLVNLEGIVRANGIARQDFKADNGDAAVISANPGLRNNPPPGTISAGTGQGVIMPGPTVANKVPDPPAAEGGTIRLVSTGQTYSVADKINAAPDTILTSSEKSTLLNRRNVLISARDGSVWNLGTIEANGDNGHGSNGEDGGTVLIESQHNIRNFGLIRASGGNGVGTATNGTNGGDGGTVALSAQDTIIQQGIIEANGGNGGNAGAVTNGTRGTSGTAQVNNQAGSGGDGGLVAFSYKTMSFTGRVNANGGVGGVGGTASNVNFNSGALNQSVSSTANAIGGTGGQGGDGGLVVFSSDVNPTGNGVVMVNGGRGGRGGNAVADAQASARGTGVTATAVANTTAGAGGQGGTQGAIVAPSPGSAPSGWQALTGGQGDSGTQQTREVEVVNGVSTIRTNKVAAVPGQLTIGTSRPVLQTQVNELLMDNEGINALLFSRSGTQTTLSGRLNNATIRTPANPTGIAVNPIQATQLAGNLFISSTGPASLTTDISNDNTNPIFTWINSLFISNNGDITNNMHWAPGVQQVGPGFHDIFLAVGGGNLAWISTGNITNNKDVLTRGFWSGGQLNMAASGNITNNGDILTTAFNKHTSSGFTHDRRFVSSHSGGATLKAGGNILNNRVIEDTIAFFDVHPPLAGTLWVRFMDAAQIGPSVYLLANGSITNASTGTISARPLVYRDQTDGSANNPANPFGGIITIKPGAGQTFTNNGALSVDSQSWTGSDGNYHFTSFSGKTEIFSQDGTIIRE